MCRFGKRLDILVWKCKKCVPLCLVRGYAEDSDDNFFKERFEGISSERVDGKDTFNSGKFSQRAIQRALCHIQRKESNHIFLKKR